MITLRTQDIAIDRSNVAARANLIGRIRYTLTDLETEEVMDSDEVSNFTGYSTFGTPVATQAAERDAEARLMQMLADQMLTRLAAAAGRPPEGSSARTRRPGIAPGPSRSAPGFCSMDQTGCGWRSGGRR